MIIYRVDSWLLLLLYHVSHTHAEWENVFERRGPDVPRWWLVPSREVTCTLSICVFLQLLLWWQLVSHESAMSHLSSHLKTFSTSSLSVCLHTGRWDTDFFFVTNKLVCSSNSCWGYVQKDKNKWLMIQTSPWTQCTFAYMQQRSWNVYRNYHKHNFKFTFFQNTVLRISPSCRSHWLEPLYRLLHAVFAAEGQLYHWWHNTS